MINHKYKCIFVHIPCTAGTYMEELIDGVNWWEKVPAEKHLTARQTKELYAEYWKDYFKFSFVRNPWSRKVSMLRHKFFQLKLNKNKIDLKEYKKKFGFPLCLEYDTRFHEYSAVLKDHHESHSVYGNILDEPLDFIGKFENLQDDLSFVLKQIGLDKKVLVKKPTKDYKSFYTRATRKEVGLLYQKDIEQYGYEFGKTAWSFWDLFG